MRSKVDIAVVQEGRLILEGWAFGKDPESVVEYEVTDGDGRPVPGTTVASVRRDSVVEAFFPDYEKKHGRPVRRELGYDINVPYVIGENHVRILIIRVDGREKRIRFDDKRLEEFNSYAHRKREKLLALVNWETVEVSLEYLRENGIRALWKKAVHKIKGIEEDYEYNEWRKKCLITERELEAQRKTEFPVRPLFSIAIPAFKTSEKFLRRMLDSIRKQTYPHFEVCVADATPYDGLFWDKKNGKLPREVLEEYAEMDSRFRFQVLGENLGISDNTNAAIRMASEKADFIVLADHDDELAPEALYECARTVNECPGVKVIYSDEDKIDFGTAVFFEPHFKTDYNPDLLRSVNYICHLFVVERGLLDSIAETDEEGNKVYERKAYDGAQDYDLILRACEAAEKDDAALAGSSEMLREGRFTSSGIRHIPKALYHWRSHQMSTASNPEVKLYAFEAGSRAVSDHLKRVGLPVERVEKGVTYGFYHPIYRILEDPATGKEPLVSVIIPNKDHVTDLDKAIRSLMGGDYGSLEFIIVENNSEQDETWAYYEKIQKELPSVRVVRWGGEEAEAYPGFNYSAINNYGVRHANGEYLLFMNNDIELIEPTSLREMMMYVQREDVGACGARLLYPDEVIQHAGVVMGFGGIAGAAFVGIHNKENTYMHRAKCIQDYSAVTAACMLSKKSVFLAAGGFETDLAVAFNDIDYCMKLRALGKKVVYNPYALFYHYESKSRGLEDTPEKVARFNSEIVKFARRWPEILRQGDPYYHPALTLRKSNFVLRDLSKEKPGEPYPMDILKGIV